MSHIHKRYIAIILALLASFLAGALSNSDVYALLGDLDYHARAERRNAAYFDGTTGIYAPAAEAYFRGRAEGLEFAAVLVNNHNASANTEP